MDQTPTTVGVGVTRPVIAEISDGIPAYDRGDWRHWTDADGDCQNTRHEVLIDESSDEVTFKTENRCQVLSGQWLGLFTGITVDQAGDLDVDHMVPLKNAHLSGGWAWNSDRRRAYANDLTDADHLIAVTRGANRSKGARGPDEWKPPDETYWCEYALDWIRIKNTWQLTVTSSEWAALELMLGTCDGGVAPIVALTATATAESAPPTPTDTPVGTPPSPTPTQTVVPAPPPPQPAPVGGSVPPADKDNCPESHPIKGNQGRTENIYHVPSGASYGRTDPEECFATEADAQAAGYRRARR